MGACGCGDFDGVRWAVTVGEYILAVSDYDGCNNGCSAPLGFTVHLMTKRSAREWQIEATGAWDPKDFDDVTLNLFSQEDLAHAARDLDKELAIDLADYDSLGDLLDEIGLDLMRAAWKRTISEERRLRDRFGESAPHVRQDFPPAPSVQAEEPNG